MTISRGSGLVELQPKFPRAFLILRKTKLIPGCWGAKRTKPVVVAVQGVCSAGVELMLNADVVISPVKNTVFGRV